MRLGTSITLAAVTLLLAAGAASAQDPSDAYIPDIRAGVYPENTIVTVRDVVVTAIFPFGMWVQEPADTSFAFSGIWCYNAGLPAVEVGQMVHVKGRYEEYFDLSEINIPAGSGQITPAGFGDVPEPKVLHPNQVRNGSPTGEDWEGCLVKVENVEVTSNNPQYGQYGVTEIGAPGDSVICDDRALNPPARPPVGATFNSITGIMDYHFSERKLQPRGDDDLDWASGEPAPDLEVAYCTSNTEVDVRFDRPVDEVTAGMISNYFFVDSGQFAQTAVRDPEREDLVHLTVANAFTPNSTVPEIIRVSGVENREGTPMVGTASRTFIAGVSSIEFVQTVANLDSSQVAGQIVTISGIVTAGTAHDFIGGGAFQYYIEHPGGGPRSGINIFDRNLVDRGDEMLIAGEVREYQGLTEIYIPDHVEILSTGNPVPGPDLVTVATLSDSLTAEPWECVFIRLENVAVADTVGLDRFGEWQVRVGPDTVTVDDEAYYAYQPVIGHELDYLQGVIDCYFTTFLVQPRNSYDIGSPNGVSVGDAGSPVVARSELKGGAPNPFNPYTNIRFAIREEGPVDLAIYDLSGRLVRTLLSGDQLASGEHSLPWDGRSDTGKALASGTYIVRFEAADVERVQKITLMK
jgi:predicted extracellular nuclease